jgi:hypothetical protein
MKHLLTVGFGSSADSDDFFVLDVFDTTFKIVWNADFQPWLYRKNGHVMTKVCNHIAITPKFYV